jgi:hypothetical protein
MTIEDKLHDLILSRYHSVREFTIAIDMPYTTMHSIFKRGIGNSSVTNIIKICKALGISADALADGEIVSVNKRFGVPTGENAGLKVENILNDTRELLTHRGPVTLNGKPLTKSGIDSIIDAMDVGVELAKKKNP